MKTTQHQTKTLTLTGRFVLLCGLALAPTTSASGQQRQATASQQLQALVRLSIDRKTEKQGLAALEQIESSTPDPRVPFMRGMLLVNRHRYQDAVHPIRESLARSAGNLDAWKTQIWLSIILKDYDEALTSLELLSRRMPRQENVSSERERKCYDFCSFQGRIFGYLAGPVGSPAMVAKVESTERAIVARLTGNRLEAFQRSRQKLLDEYEVRTAKIFELTEAAKAREADYRADALVDLDQERESTLMQLAEIEELRVSGRKSAAVERNVIAATRDKRAQGSTSGGTTRFVAGRVGLLGNRVRARRSSYGSRSGSWVDRGLGDRHYADVNRREKESDDRLTKRETELKRMLRRIAKDKSNLLRKPNTGVSGTAGNGHGAMVLSMKSKAKALTTYVALPVDPLRQIGKVLASYRTPAKPAATAVAMNQVSK